MWLIFSIIVLVDISYVLYIYFLLIYILWQHIYLWHNQRTIWNFVDLIFSFIGVYIQITVVCFFVSVFYIHCMD